LSEKKKKRGKTRTQAKFHYGCVQGMKQSFAHFSPKYAEVLQARKRTRPRLNADGTRHKVDSVFWSCESCGREVTGKEGGLEVDHRDPVIPIGKHYSEMSMQEIFERLDCPRHNLWAICQECHEVKTAHEKALRKESREQRHK
jgi:hypothetical protein